MSGLLVVVLLWLCVTVRADAADTADPASSCAAFTLMNEGMVDAESMLNASHAANVTVCCALCTLDPACVAFTFQVHRKSCRMTSWPSPHKDPQEGVQSGVSKSRKPPPGPAPPGPRPAPPPPLPPKYPKYCATHDCKNVLYFLADDMRADWGAYGLPVSTPHLDALAKDALLFEHAFCQMSVCSPSRQSFMTSRRPDTHQVWNFIDANPLNTSATPGHFRDHGYLTLGLGKTFHENGGAWNANAYWSTDVLPYFTYSSNHCPHGSAGGGHCILPDEQIWDYKLLQSTLSYLDHAMKNYGQTRQPFFLMTGFRDPHAPWAAPQRMYDLYNESAIQPPHHKVLDPSVPQIAWSHQLSVQLANGTSFPFGPYEPVPDWVNQNNRHAYYAAVSYVDEHIGATLAKLQAADLYESAVVVMHADHGYALGEHGMWEKKSNWDMAVRVPLLVKVPGKPKAAGQVTKSYTDLVDVFPTLAAVAGLSAPEGLDGDDVSAVFDDPTTNVKTSAYHQYPACGMNTSHGFNVTRGACNSTPKNKFNYMGYTVRTPDWRFTLWVEWDDVKLQPKWDGPSAEELYDHKNDNSSSFDLWENVNIATENPAVSQTMKAQLLEFFRKH